MMADVVSITTGKPVISARKEAAQHREALIRDGKRWQKFIERIGIGELKITITVAGEELGFDDKIIPYIDSLVDEDDKENRSQQRKKRYNKTKK